MKSKEYDTAWFIIDPTTTQERFFSTEKSFRDALFKLGIDTIALQRPDDYYNTLYNKNK